MRKTFLFVATLTLSLAMNAERSDVLLKNGWTFHKGDTPTGGKVEKVSVPHDWAITGPFDRSNDLQNVAIVQNGETEESVKTGRTGGLPYVGVGTYNTTFEVAQTEGKSISLLFDGAMSEAQVYVNGQKVCFWPYGYNAFYCDVTSVVKQGTNTLKVRLENRDQSSRWYGGAGLYRNVHVITTEKVHIPIWGTHITTPVVKDDYATVKLKTTVEGIAMDEAVTISTKILDNNGNVVASDSTIRKRIPELDAFEQNFLIDKPALWSPETPNLYNAVTSIYSNGAKVDEYTTRFGVRSIEFQAEKGFFLNGKNRKFQGVCIHHDLGPLGTAINVSAMRYRLQMLKDMGCDAIRTSHNMPSPELVSLCEEMGFMMMVETFDEWDIAKCNNGYHRYFNEWYDKDITNVVKHYRNSPAVAFWGIGNEVPSQWQPEGRVVLKKIQDLCHELDPTRPCVCGMDQVDAVLSNGFGAIVDLPGFNYRVQHYQRGYKELPQKILLGSETASTVSSRGVYMFPVKVINDITYDNHQSSSYDTEFNWWSNIPDIDFAAADDNQWEIGQFVWTGFDYLGEPSPYDTDAWPNHSSMYGIIDLASIPKDRYYLYRSQWNKNSETLHILPHWTFPERVGQVTPVFVYTSYPKAELFINGKSQGVRCKNDSTVLNRYRLMWNETKYEPGEVKVVAYDKDGNVAETKVTKTAGKAVALRTTVHQCALKANGEDLAFITVEAVDKDGNVAPNETNEVTFSVKGAGTFKATANGDPTCLYQFQNPKMPLFSGALTAIVQSSTKAGSITFEAKAKGLKSAKATIVVK